MSVRPGTHNHRGKGEVISTAEAVSGSPLFVSIDGIMARYNVCRAIAREIGEESGAAHRLGTRTIRYDTKTLDEYVLGR